MVRFSAFRLNRLCMLAALNVCLLCVHHAYSCLACQLVALFSAYCITRKYNSDLIFYLCSGVLLHAGPMNRLTVLDSNDVVCVLTILCVSSTVLVRKFYFPPKVL